MVKVSIIKSTKEALNNHPHSTKVFVVYYILPAYNIDIKSYNSISKFRCLG